MAGDPKKIDAADFKAMRDGKKMEKEEACPTCGKSPCTCSMKESDDALTDRNVREHPGRRAEIKNIIMNARKKIFGEETVEEEAEQIDELKTGTYVNYMKSADKDKAKHLQGIVSAFGDKDKIAASVKNVQKRVKGMDTAHRRILDTASKNEEVEFTEEEAAMIEAIAQGLDELTVRDVTGKLDTVKKVPVRKASGKVETDDPGKSGSSGS